MNLVRFLFSILMDLVEALVVIFGFYTVLVGSIVTLVWGLYKLVVMPVHTQVRIRMPRMPSWITFHDGSQNYKDGLDILGLTPEDVGLDPDASAWERDIASGELMAMDW